MVAQPSADGRQEPPGCPESCRGYSQEEENMTPDFIHARVLYQLAQKVEDCARLWPLAKIGRGSGAVEDLGIHVRDAVAGLLGLDLEGWYCATNVPMDILLVLGALIPSMDFEDACTVCGLSAVRTMTPREAEHLLNRAVVAYS